MLKISSRWWLKVPKSDLQQHQTMWTSAWQQRKDTPDSRLGSWSGRGLLKTSHLKRQFGRESAQYRYCVIHYKGTEQWPLKLELSISLTQTKLYKEIRKIKWMYCSPILYNNAVWHYSATIQFILFFLRLHKKAKLKGMISQVFTWKDAQNH